jgi:hypothetical protein
LSVKAAAWSRVTSCRSENGLSYVIDRIGPQGCVFASDFRHEIALERIAEIEEILEGFNDEHKSMILGEDAQEILQPVE